MDYDKTDSGKLKIDAIESDKTNSESISANGGARTALPLVAIVGKPNVGKSSLFNRFLRRRLAVVDDEPGVTRDRNYSVCDWNGRDFQLVDTGGMLPGDPNQLAQSILAQAEIAIAEADVILFVVDSQAHLEEIDERIARSLQNSGRKTILVANKADNEAFDSDATRFYSLGLGEPRAVSALVGRNSGDLLDDIVSLLPAASEEQFDSNSIRIAVVGRPNVGKSSLINKLIGEERQIVSETAGTTRDAVDSQIRIGEQDFTLVDTAGMRRSYKVVEDIEFYINLRASRALRSCDIALIVFDASEGLTSQDKRIIELAHEFRRGMILVANKWDLVEKDSKTADHMTVDLNDKLGIYSFMKITYISALTGKRVHTLLKEAEETYQRFTQRIRTSEINEFLAGALERRPPASTKGKEVKLNYVSQPDTGPPTFVFFSNHPKLIQRSYIRFLENRLRERFDLMGVPIRLKFLRK